MNDRQPSLKILRDILYTRDEVARLAKVCTRTVARDVRAGRLEEIRYNRRRIRYRRGAVEAYLAGNYPLGEISEKWPSKSGGLRNRDKNQADER
jgi:hypothetical protein